MIKAAAKSESSLAVPELTPLIDIVFIVIVFLLITANVPLLKLPVDIPQTDNEAALTASTPSVLTVTIDKVKPYWSIEQQTYADWPSFKAALLARLGDPSMSLTIAADKAAPTEPLLQLLALLNQQQISNTQIIMQQPGTSS
ncbi:outer membrane transport energization protein ExbD [Sinobacterium caligoides]|uniref:Outer membrane transport energization protein ExbD n=1 Tax=Sinobacterium caligoides TaxID=933926 RepID=A0A3N2DKM7_9GAMM|nr:biopolymer transporter ExbD [Sinobacterium caligoides]ROS00347.1 outer membrane transport energization protein ExbD [Sinobacterium caligoides]